MGAGPGDPELITVKGARLLKQADYVLSTGSLVPRELFDGISAEVEDSKGLDIDQIVDRLATAARTGRRVVRVHTGDPAIFGAVQEQRARLHALGIPTATVPGVTSALAAAAALDAELTLPGLTQTVVFSRTAGRTPMPPAESLAALAALGNSTLCLYLSASLTDKVARELVAGGRSPDTPVAVVQYASMAHKQRILRCTLATLADEVRAARIRAQAMLLVGPAVDPHNKERVGEFDSRLYARDFSHRFRKAADTTHGSTPRTPRGRCFEPAATLEPGHE
ncbi:MAG: precorrin-4 C(11)-methyltransferase [Deltaproteobacteria bacterium]|nr:MAG: precorrin-4 C(11)-methyltransferase [Deltaproteobacteria bacterium]